MGILIVPSAFADHLSDLEAEVKSQTDIGTVMIEKSEYRIAPRETLYVKIFGEIDMDNIVNLPIDYTKFVSFETTNPDGTKFITEVGKTQTGYFENRIPITYHVRGDSSPFGQYQVYVTYKGNSLGDLTFSVVDKAEAEAADQAAAQAAAEAKAAAQVAAAQAAAEAKAAAQAAAEAEAAYQAAAEARAEAAQVAAEAAAEARAEAAQAAVEAKVAVETKAATSQTAAAIIVLAIIAIIIVVIAIITKKSRKNQVDQIKQTNDTMSAHIEMTEEHNRWRNTSKPAKEEPKEEEGVMFCTNCGNRLTKAGAKFCKKCGSAQ